MRALHCPHCGRWLAETDAPPGYQVRVPPCRECKANVIFKTERSYPPRPEIARGSGTR